MPSMKKGNIHCFLLSVSLFLQGVGAGVFVCVRGGGGNKDIHNIAAELFHMTRSVSVPIHIFWPGRDSC